MYSGFYKNILLAPKITLLFLLLVHKKMNQIKWLAQELIAYNNNQYWTLIVWFS